MNDWTALERGGANAIAVTQGFVGDEWNLLIVRYAIAGAARYGDWLERLPISNAVLATRLSGLVELGVLERKQYRSRPPRSEYVLTKCGRELLPTLLAIWGWELEWVPQHGVPVPPMHHIRCDCDFLPRLTCGTCDLPIRAREVTGEFGPAGGWPRSVPSSTTRRRSGNRPAWADSMFPQTFGIIGNRWSTAMMGAAFAGAARFKEFEQRLGAPPAIVAERLKSFCDMGILEQRPGRERAEWAEYHLTEKGRGFFAVVMTAVDWGQRWFRSPEGPAMVFDHAGHRFVPQLSCGHCLAPLHGADIANVDGLTVQARSAQV